MNDQEKRELAGIVTRLFAGGIHPEAIKDEIERLWLTWNELEEAGLRVPDFDQPIEGD